MPKTTKTMYRDGSVHCTGKTSYKKTTQGTPPLHLLFYLKSFCEFSHENPGPEHHAVKEKDVGMRSLV